VLIRTSFSNHRIVTNDTLDTDVKVPAALNLPFGKLFFGFQVTPYVAPEKPKTPEADEAKVRLRTE